MVDEEEQEEEVRWVLDHSRQAAEWHRHQLRMASAEDQLPEAVADVVAEVDRYVHTLLAATSNGTDSAGAIAGCETTMHNERVSLQHPAHTHPRMDDAEAEPAGTPASVALSTPMELANTPTPIPPTVMTTTTPTPPMPTLAQLAASPTPFPKARSQADLAEPRRQSLRLSATKVFHQTQRAALEESRSQMTLHDIRDQSQGESSMAKWKLWIGDRYRAWKSDSKKGTNQESLLTSRAPSQSGYLRLAAACQLLTVFLKQLGKDLAALSSSKRHAINMSDVETQMRQQQFVSDRVSVADLARKHLPKEVLDAFLPKTLPVRKRSKR
eukprot:jgi/Chlat1/6069/Chrsp4S06340